MDLPRLASSSWHRLVGQLGLAPPAPGHRPPPGASLHRMMYAFLWLALGVTTLSIFTGARSWAVLALAGVWFARAALDIGRARRLLQAEQQAGAADEDDEPLSGDRRPPRWP